VTQPTEDAPRNPAQAAGELARLAARSRNPAERLWYLQWAQAFSQLAAFGDRAAAAQAARDEDDEDFDDGARNRG
jgi:hypothetical protein